MEKIPKRDSNSNSVHSNNINQHRNLHKQNSHISMSDTESQVSQIDSFHSPLRSDSPLRSFDDPDRRAKSIAAVDKYYSPLRSPHKPSSENLSLPPTPIPTPPSDAGKDRNSPVVYFNRAFREDTVPGVTKVGPVRHGDVEEAEVGGQRRSRAGVGSSIERLRKEAMLSRVGLGFRICEVILCLISFSVMAADKTRGWTGDSFDRYIEYRYCVAVNVIGLVYSAFQAFDLSYNLATRKHFLSHNLRYYFDFSMDQILAYLLMSASSSAATRVTDWISNWGKDEFTEMASASIGLSFLAFIAFAFSSLISGYSLCNRDSS